MLSVLESDFFWGWRVLFGVSDIAAGLTVEFVLDSKVNKG